MQTVQNTISYQLHILLEEPATIVIGKLGTCAFPKGKYVYTGSAKKNIEARVARHLRTRKTLRWHIDYLLAHARCLILAVDLSARNECELNQSTPGIILIPRLGATDCSRRCGSHLKYLSHQI